MTPNGAGPLKITLSIFLLFFFLFIHLYAPEWLCLGKTIAGWGQIIGIFGILISGFILSIFLARGLLYKVIQSAAVRLFSVGTLAIIIWVVLVVGIIKVNNLTLRMAIERAISKGNLIVTSINEYKIKNGRYPISLEELNLAIPNTNICGFQNFTYVISKDEVDKLNDMTKKAERNESLSINDASSDTGGYELTVEMPRGILNWDVLVYWPLEKYPNYLKGGYAERFNSWVYVHE